MIETMQTPCGDHQEKVAAQVVVDVANQLAEEGWELIAVCPNTNKTMAERWQLVAYFKRKKMVRDPKGTM